MEQIVKNLANLIKVKSLFSMAAAGVFVYLACSGQLSMDNVMLIISMVVSFYFGTQHEKSAIPTA